MAGFLITCSAGILLLPLSLQEPQKELAAAAVRLQTGELQLNWPWWRPGLPSLADHLFSRQAGCGQRSGKGGVLQCIGIPTTRAPAGSSTIKGGEDKEASSPHPYHPHKW